MKMKAIGSEISAAVFLLAMAMGGRSIQEVGALSGNGAAATTTRSGSKPSTISTVYLGGEDKEIQIFVPEKSSTQFSKNAESKRRSTNHERGTSGFALSQLIAHCPSIVNERKVLELSAGLGMVSAVACKYSRPDHVAITGRDKSLLSMAYASCVQLQRSRASVSRCHMDWNKPATWPQQEYDMLLAADVLCDKRRISSLVNVIQHYLCNDSTDNARKQAVIVDPVGQQNRQAFLYAARRAGLNVEETEFPGSPNLMLLNISPSGQ